MYASSLLPVLLFLASANAIAIDRNQGNVNANDVAETKVVNGVTLTKRDNCFFDPFGIIFSCSNGSGTSSSASKSSSTSASKSSSTSSSSSSSSASASKSSASFSSSSSSAAATTTSSSSAAASSSSSSSSSSASSASASKSSSASSSSSSSVAASSSSSSSSAAAASSSSSSSAAAVVTPSVVVVPSSSAVVSSASSVVSSIISSVSSAAASSTSSAVVVVVPTTTSTSASSSTSSAAPTPTNAAVSGWRYAQDIQEGTNGRALTAAATAGQTMTVETCLAYCDSLNFPLAGLEYGAECYCGTVLSNGASLAKTATATMSCAGNAQELCGGPSTLSLYVSTKSNSAGLSSDLSSQAVSLPAGWASANCIQEVSGRALVEKSTASDDMTIGKCLAFCGNYKYAGLEYGRECYCGNTLQNGASLTSTSGQCVTPCAGMSTNTCGGPNALQMYTNGNYKAASTGAYVSSGCVQEVAGRALRGASTAGPNMTIDTCTSFCASQGFKIAGLEYGQECYCDNVWQGGASGSNYSGQCNMPCAGNSAQNCGGPNAINVYTLGA